jgi:peroxiredoxin
MKRFVYIVIFLSMLAASCQNRNTCSITGTITNARDSTVLYLINLDSSDMVDSVIVENGQFNIKLPLSYPSKFVLHNKRDQHAFRDRKYIWLEPNKISINGNFDFLKNLQVNGSVSNMEFEKYQQLVDDGERKISKLNDYFLFRTGSEKATGQIRIDSLKEELSDEIVRFMIEHNNSYMALSELHDECYLASRHLTKQQIKNVYNSLSNTLKEMPQANEIKKYMELPEPPKLGDQAPEIIQFTPAGDTIRLSDFKGKYVLLDFWSSSCGPCRGEFKWLRKLYAKYEKKGLIILGISGDNKKQEWVNAIKNDSISWINISDLHGWKNEAFLLYDIKGIPSKLLIDPDGRIVKDYIWLSSESITNHVLSEIFEKKGAL